MATPTQTNVLTLVPQADTTPPNISLKMVEQLKAILEMVKTGKVDTFTAVLLTTDKEMHSFCIQGKSRFASIGAIDTGYEMIINNLKRGLDND